MGSKLDMGMTPEEVGETMQLYAWEILEHAEACYELVTKLEETEALLTYANKRILEMENEDA